MGNVLSTFNQQGQTFLAQVNVSFLLYHASVSVYIYQNNCTVRELTISLATF